MCWDTGLTDNNGHPFEVQHEIRAASVVARMASLDENVQVNGYTFIFDFSGFGTKHMTHMSMEDMRNWHSCWQVRICDESLTKNKETLETFGHKFGKCRPIVYI